MPTSCDAALHRAREQLLLIFGQDRNIVCASRGGHSVERRARFRPTRLNPSPTRASFASSPLQARRLSIRVERPFRGSPREIRIAR